MNRNIVGITIGPIIEVLCKVTKPVASWEASMFFSEMCHRLCDNIAREGNFEQLSIVAPYYDAASGNSEFTKTWIGKFHDRVIFMTSSDAAVIKEKLNNIIHKVKEDMYDLIKTGESDSRKKDYLSEYIQIHYIVKELDDSDSPISIISPYLDALELCRTIPRNNELNPFDDLFSCNKDDVNKRVIQTNLYKNNMGAEQFKSGDRIVDIEQIAAGSLSPGKREKWRNYYAVVTADGDNMGKVINELDAETTTRFSKACFTYNEKAAELIRAYGGVVIYAGGDDLLFLAPVCSTNIETQQDNIFSLCKNINTNFKDIMTCMIKDIEKPGEAEGNKYMELADKLSVSFGVSVQYYKYPLQEAMSRSRYLMEGYAKNDMAGTILSGEDAAIEYSIARSNITFHLQKHSGQSVCFGVKNDKVDVINKLLSVSNETIEQTAEKGEINETILHSVLYKIALHWTTLRVADENIANKSDKNESDYLAVWENIFDNIGQEKFKDYIKNICNIYHDDFLAESVPWVEGYGDDEYEMKTLSDKLRKALVNILRLKHFLLQKGGER